VHIIAVLELPPRAFCKILVNFESLKLINCFEPALSLLITFDRANKLRLMLEPSLSLIPSAYVLLTPSEPAKSTRFSWEIFVEPSFAQFETIFILKTVCDRDEFSFSLVSAILRYSSPCSISLRTYSAFIPSFSDRRLM